MERTFFTENEFAEKMAGEVAAWREKYIKEEIYHSYDGTLIHSLIAENPEAKAAVVLVHGFTEYADRYHEVLYYFFREGYSVYMTDNRGHGKSERKIKDNELVYVEKFDEYVEDLRFFIDSFVLPSSGDLPLYLYAHSMGGAIAALFLEKYPSYFQKAVLSSPMLKIKLDGPDIAADSLAAFSKVARWNDKPMFGAASFTGEPDFENCCGTSEARYNYEFQQQLNERSYRTCAATFAWARAAIAATKKLQRNAAKVSTPVLICQAGNDLLVENAGQDRFAARAKGTRIRRYPEAKHEIWNSTDDVLTKYYGDVFGFLG